MDDGLHVQELLEASCAVAAQVGPIYRFEFDASDKAYLMRLRLVLRAGAVCSRLVAVGEAAAAESLSSWFWAGA